MATPVVLVPGILGSALGYRKTNGQLKRIWYDQAWLVVHGPDDFQLAADGDAPGPLAKAGDLEPIADLPDWGPYSSLAARLVLEGWETRWFAYDWRKSIMEAAARLASFLLETLHGRDYYVVAHSMGGLVCRLAYGLVVAAGGAARWKRTLYVGVPQYGSYQAAQYLARPDQQLPTWGWMITALGGVPVTAVTSIFLQRRNTNLRAVVSTWPALYELLPDVSGTWSQDHPLDSRLWVAANYHAENPGVRQEWMTAAQNTRTAINATVAAPRPSERIVLGTELFTPNAVRNTGPFGDEQTYGIGPGDGSVTEERGALSGAAVKQELRRAVHSDLLADPRFLQRVTALLLDADPPVTEDAPLKQSVVPLHVPAPDSSPVPLLFIDLQRRGDP